VQAIPVFAGLSDGPYRTEHLESKLIGRVVGVAPSPLGLAPAAGWENEEAGNAAFDAAEYIGVLLAADYKPYVFPEQQTRLGLWRAYPERRLTESEQPAGVARAVRAFDVDGETAACEANGLLVSAIWKGENGAPVLQEGAARCAATALSIHRAGKSAGNNLACRNPRTCQRRTRVSRAAIPFAIRSYFCPKNSSGVFLV
jgi:hypothetical protein